MDRRGFLRCGAFATAASAQAATAQTVATATAAVSSTNAAHSPGRPADVLVRIRRRSSPPPAEYGILPRAWELPAEHLVTDYLPGQCCYNLGEYPGRKPWDPDDWDEQELDALRDQGIRLIQVHEEWNDSQRLFGAHKLGCGQSGRLSPLRGHGPPPGHEADRLRLQRLLRADRPRLPRRMGRPGDLVEIYFRYAHCSPASPGWRAYFLPRLVRILDEYGVDGIYNDLGLRAAGRSPKPAARRSAGLRGERRRTTARWGICWR